MAVALPTELHPIARMTGLEPMTYCLILSVAECILKLNLRQGVEPHTSLLLVQHTTESNRIATLSGMCCRYTKAQNEFVAG